MRSTTSPVPTRRSCEAALLMGAPLDAPSTGRALRGLPSEDALLASPLTLITGPSGAGKSMLLAHTREAFKRARVPVIDANALRPPDKPCVDLLAPDTLGAVRALASVGLAELGCFVRRPRELSEGQRLRLSLALAIDKAPKTKLGAILIEHRLELLSAIADRTVVLDLGEVIATGTPREVFDDPRVHAAYFEEPADA